MLDHTAINIQSSIRIEAEGKVIYFDPFQIADYPHDADIIFFTHPHYDHFSPKDIEKVKKEGTFFVAPESMQNDLESNNLRNNAFVLPNQQRLIKDISVETTHAYNIDKSYHPVDNDWVGYILMLEGNRFFITGDTDCTDDVKRVRCDVIFLPIGGTFTMNPKEAADAVNAIMPRIAVPTHYGSIVGDPLDAERFRSFVDQNVNVRILIQH